MSKILVLGAGVSGLSCAKLLQDGGYEVEIWTKDLPENTTSSIPAAFIYPYLCNPREKAVIWSRKTLDYLKQNVINDPTAGVRQMRVTEYYDESVADPWWVPAVDGFDRLPARDLPDQYQDSTRAGVALTDVTRYLPWLVAQVKAAGATMQVRTAASFSEAFEDHDIVINCTGLGSIELCGDTSMYPVRGQVLSVKSIGLTDVECDDHGHNSLLYIVPRFDDIIVGGTAQKDDWNLDVDPADTEDILRRAASFSPKLANLEVLATKVGLRPARPEVRLELEPFGGNKYVVHNYGHGGAGYTLSWGCADDVLHIVNSVTQ
jgi:D-amino-acid oxidase